MITSISKHPVTLDVVNHNHLTEVRISVEGQFYWIKLSKSETRKVAWKMLKSSLGWNV